MFFRGDARKSWSMSPCLSGSISFFHDLAPTTKSRGSGLIVLVEYGDVEGVCQVDGRRKLSSGHARSCSKAGLL
jgi:hypothetical protein